MVATLWFFLIYAFLGWCAEVAFAAIKRGRFVNRGFLFGPICPMYGVGVVLVLWLLQPFQGQWLAQFALAALLTTLVEYLTGLILDKCFHQRWWDYSKMPLNLQGYICLLFSLLWGAACLAIVYWLHPLVARLVALVPPLLSNIALPIFGALFLVDLSMTLATLMKLNLRLKQIDEIGRLLRLPSDELGKALASNALIMRGLGKDAQRKALAGREGLQNHLLDVKSRMEYEQKRLINAFPDVQARRPSAALDELKSKLARRRDG